MSKSLKDAKASRLRPHIRAILERTRLARAELDALIKEPHGPTTPGCDAAQTAAAPAPTADPLAGRETPQLDNGRRRRTPRNPDPAPQPKPDGGSPPPVPPRNDRNPRRRQGAVQPASLVPKDALIALFKTGVTVAQAAVQYPDVSKGTLVAIKANTTRGAYK
jgi:hypothetical protein